MERHVNKEGGKFTVDKSFATAPKGFLDFAKKQWNKFKVEESFEQKQIATISDVGYQIADFSVKNTIYCHTAFVGVFSPTNLRKQQRHYPCYLTLASC